MASSRIQVDHVARIEGHGNIHIQIADGKLERVALEVVEPARLFNAIVQGRSFHEISYIASRICGICSSSHVITNLRAIEAIFGIVPSDRTNMLRELLVYGSYLQNHATHLFMFALPDYFCESSVFPFSQTHPHLYQGGLELKRMGNRLCTCIGGRSVHPITAVIGGFTSEISPREYKALAEELESHIDFACETVDLFAHLTFPDFDTQGDLLAMQSSKESSYAVSLANYDEDLEIYPIVQGDSCTLLRSQLSFSTQNFFDYIEEYEVAHGAAKFCRPKNTLTEFSSKTQDNPRNFTSYMASPLARLNTSWSKLSKRAKVAAAKASIRPPKYNPYLNNIAQAIELVDCLERCAYLCRVLAEGEGTSTPAPFEVRSGSSIGYTEAPRGALFHHLELDEAGCVVDAHIVTPTAQNLANLEADMRILAQNLLDAGSPELSLKREIEKLVRAYDPCLSCSVH